MARFAVSNSHDQSAALWIMTFLLLSYTSLTILVRGFVKVSMLGLDDGIAGLAQLLTYGNVFSIIYALLHGLARSSLDDRTDKVSDNYAGALQASVVFYLLTLSAAKAATVLFLKRVFRQSGFIHAMLSCKIATMIMGSWGIASVVALSANCTMETLWLSQDHETCNGNARWLTVTSGDGFTEVILIIMVVWLVSQLQMTVRKKAEVCSAFAWRLGLIVMASCHYRSYVQMIDSANKDVAISKIVIWEQASICYSLLSITWPFSKVFINSFDTAQVIPTACGSGSATFGSTAAKSKRRVNSSKLSSRVPWQDNAGHSSTVYSRPVELRQDNAGFGSQELIIRRDDEVRVSYGEARTPTAQTTRQ